MAKPLRPEDENRTYRRFGDFTGYTDYSEAEQNDYPTVSQTFQTDQKKRTLNGTRDVNVSYKTKGAATRTSGRAIQTTGKGMQAAGAAADVAGTGMMRAGAALSGTGLGAVVGVPLAALGGATKAGGRATHLAGKQASRQGKRVSKIGKTRRGFLKSAKATRATIWVISTGLGIFYTLQFFIGLAYLISFGILGAVDKIVKEDPVLGFVARVGEGLFGDGTTWADALKAATGIDVGGIFIVTFTLSLLWGFITLLFLSFMYMLQGIKPFWGEGAGLKNGLFLFTLICYVLPILNILPVFILWALAVWKYPK